MVARHRSATHAQEPVMIKIRQPQSARRQADRRAAAASTPAAAQRVAQPTALDEKQLKQVAGGTAEAPKGTW
jgi:hypothetical protein